MPTYQIEGKRFRRKNLYIPCVIADRIDDLSPEEQVKVYKKTWWCDLLTESEWRTILDSNPPSYKQVVRSKLKKKVVAWIIALGRVATFDTDLYNEATKQARELYKELCDVEHPLFKKEAEP